jgi:hypothetical protein
LLDQPRQLLQRIGPGVASRRALVRRMRPRVPATLIGHLRLDTTSGTAEAEVEDAIGHLRYNLIYPFLPGLPTSRDREGTAVPLVISFHPARRLLARRAPKQAP